MTAETTATDRRAHLHGMWSAVAGAWAEHADYIDVRSAALTQELLRRSAPQPGDQVLELACGPGGLGLAAAALVAPGGGAVLSDVRGWAWSSPRSAPSWVSRCRRRAFPGRSRSRMLTGWPH